MCTFEHGILLFSYRFNAAVVHCFISHSDLLQYNRALPTILVDVEKRMFPCFYIIDGIISAGGDLRYQRSHNGGTARKPRQR